MSDEGGSVTLVFYRIGTGTDLFKEPFLNIVAAAFQMSSFTHVEIAIGSEAGSMGQMSNVCRIFNDDIGVELTSRTGRNPQYSYLSLGCSKKAEQTMLNYARSLVGKPFSNIGMARSILFPRHTTGESFFCAELVASVLKRGGLMSSTSNPGAATPQSLHRLYKNQAAVTANPYTLRQFSASGVQDSERQRLLGFQGMMDRPASSRAYPTSSSASSAVSRKRGDSPPRASFRCVSVNSAAFRVTR